jgi:hypothetical protein
MALGPAVLIVLRVYLQIYVEHEHRLDRLAQRLPLKRAPTLMPLRHPITWTFSAFALYLLLPSAVLMFAWKAAVFPSWGAGLLSVAIAVIAMHLMLSFRRLTWLSKACFSASAAILALIVLIAMLRLDSPLRRPFDLVGADLSGQWLLYRDLKGANLFSANLLNANLNGTNLTGADLAGANLTGANLINANLTRAMLLGTNLSGADLSAAYLTDAKLFGANLTGADLTGADLSGANLRRANLTRAILTSAFLADADVAVPDPIPSKGVSQAQLDEACGENVKLDAGLTIKLCRQR